MKKKLLMLTALSMSVLGLQNQALACYGHSCVGLPAETVVKSCPISWTSQPTYFSDNKSFIILRWSEKCGVNWAVLRSSAPLPVDTKVGVAVATYGGEEREYLLTQDDIRDYGTVKEISSPAIYGRGKKIQAYGRLPNAEYIETSAY